VPKPSIHVDPASACDLAAADLDRTAHHDAVAADMLTIFRAAYGAGADGTALDDTLAVDGAILLDPDAIRADPNAHPLSGRCPGTEGRQSGQSQDT